MPGTIPIKPQTLLESVPYLSEYTSCPRVASFSKAGNLTFARQKQPGKLRQEENRGHMDCRVYSVIDDPGSAFTSRVLIHPILINLF
jgi:hypothetical protein